MIAPDIVPLVFISCIFAVPETTNPVCTVKLPTSSEGVSTSANTPVVALTVIPVIVVPLIVPPVIEVNWADVPVVVTPVNRVKVPVLAVVVVPEIFTPLTSCPVISVALTTFPVIIAALTSPVTVRSFCTITPLKVDKFVTVKPEVVVASSTVKLSCIVTLPLTVPPVLGR